MLKLQDKTIVIVTAHPDDLEWYLGGTVCQLAPKNRIIHIIATNGAACPANGLSEAELVAARRREQLAAAAVTGIKETLFFDLPDGDLAYGSLPTLRVRLYRAMRTYRPNVLFTFVPESGLDPHPDHAAVGRTAMEAACQAARTRLFADGAAEPYAPPEEFYFFADYMPAPDFVNDIEAAFERKLEALKCHLARTAADWKKIQADVKAVAAEYGGHVGKKYGEAFAHLIWQDGHLVQDAARIEEKTTAAKNTSPKRRTSTPKKGG